MNPTKAENLRRALVRNASDPEQVNRADRKTKDRDRQSLEYWRAVLQTEAGRHVLWGLLAECRVFETIWDPSSRIHYNAGRQDVGHWIVAAIDRADPEALARMRQDVQREEEQTGRETEAMHHGKKEEGEDEEGLLNL